MNWKIENHNILLNNENLYINNTDINFEGEVKRSVIISFKSKKIKF